MLPSYVHEPNFIEHSWSSNGNQRMSIAHVEINSTDDTDLRRFKTTCDNQRRLRTTPKLTQNPTGLWWQQLKSQSAKMTRITLRRPVDWTEAHVEMNRPRTSTASEITKGPCRSSDDLDLQGWTGREESTNNDRRGRRRCSSETYCRCPRLRYS